MAERILLKYIPPIASISLWVYYIMYQAALLAALIVTVYTVLLYFVIQRRTLDGVIEFSEKEDGKKSFQLIVNKDPESFQNQDKVIFLFKDVS